MLGPQRNRMARRLVDDDEGVTAVEFALLAPVLMILLFAVLQISLIYFNQFILEYAANNASRLGKTGYAEDIDGDGDISDAERETTIWNELVKRAGATIDMSKVVMTKLSYDDFSDVGVPEPWIDANSNGKWDEGENFTDTNGNGVWDQDRGSLDAGGSGDVTVYTIVYPYKLLFPYDLGGVTGLKGDKGEIDLSARVVVKNEPF